VALPLAWVALCLGVAFLGALATAAGVRDWYPTLAKPAWNPPAWLFGPVWTVLYVTMGLAAARVQRSAGSFRGARGALLCFLLQLTLNGLWSWLFFARRDPLAGLVDIVLLFALVLATIVAFRRWDRAAAWMLVPYAAWVGFATALNATLWRLNG
jgi:tryptophan-rich sensory protein